MDFNIPKDHYKITINWLLGFVEEDGWFSYTPQTKSWAWGIAHKGNDKALLEAIGKFLRNLAYHKGLDIAAGNEESGVFIYPIKTKKDVYFIVIRQRGILEKLIIPIFDSLNWHTQKYLDYCDWKTILNFYNKGFNYLPEGKDLIQLIVSQMNYNRLSTHKVPKIDRTLLQEDIAKLLSGPSNYEIKEGKKFIKSLGRYVRHEGVIKAQAIQLIDLESENIIRSFNSFHDCSKFLGISTPTVSNRLSKETQFLYEGKLAYLKRVSG